MANKHYPRQFKADAVALYRSRPGAQHRAGVPMPYGAVHGLRGTDMVRHPFVGGWRETDRPGRPRPSRS
jgi:hypothetical protein